MAGIKSGCTIPLQLATSLGPKAQCDALALQRQNGPGMIYHRRFIRECMAGKLGELERARNSPLRTTLGEAALIAPLQGRRSFT
jgi:hypothetical protein